MADDKKPDCPGANRDVLHLGPELPGGFHPYVRHRPGCTVESGIIKARPDQGNDEAMPNCDGIIRLSSTGTPNTFDVESLYEKAAPPTDVASRSGPAMVSTDAYRDGWDRIFGAPKVVGQA